MNARRQLYKKYRLEGLSAYQSALKAGYTIATAKNATSKFEKGGDFEALFVKAGLDDNSLLTKITEGIEAMRVISADVFIRDENGKLKVNKNSNDWIEVPDWQARHKFIELALKLMKKLEEKAVNIENSNITQYVVFRNPKAINEERKEKNRVNM